MEFEWDEAKRQANILKHGIDFVDAGAIFDRRFVETEDAGATTARDGTAQSVGLVN